MGVDYFNVIDGPSNGRELIRFFLDAVQEIDMNGQMKLQRGDTVVMDNCGFHHTDHYFYIFFLQNYFYLGSYRYIKFFMYIVNIFSI